VLGILYESFIHPLTILSTLPSAGIGGLLALMLLHYDFFTHRPLIGVIFAEASNARSPPMPPTAGLRVWSGGE